jgi:asparagine synthase (glutamine-hydrolysing)
LGAIAGVLTRGSENVESLVQTMLGILSHRGSHSRTTTMSDNVSTKLLAGYASHAPPETQMFQTEEAATVLDGSIYETSEPARFVQGRLTSRSPLTVQARALLLTEPGGFACIVQQHGEFYALRDLNGLKPLYYGNRGSLTAFASERKALWRIGLNDVNRVRPGYLYSVSGQTFDESRLAGIPRPRAGRLTLDNASSRLSVLLRDSVRRMTSGIGKLCVAFSGGLDSALTAFLARKEKCNLEAVSVGLPGSPELSTVERFAGELDIHVTIETFGVDSLEEYVRRVVWLIEEPNLMKVSVAVPLHWAAMIARKLGFGIMLCGQGSDELYGGYSKYARTLGAKGRKELEGALYRSVVESAQVNYERDEQATALFGVELRTAFTDLDVIKFSLSIPSQFKVKSGNDLTRKWVLRRVAEQEGLPPDMVWRRKKAIQHGTGVENAIRKLAKKRGLTPEGYLLSIHKEMIGLETMP